MTGGAEGLVGQAGTALLRSLAESSGLRGRLSKALAVPGFVPEHDRGQVLVDLACALGLGATSISGITLLGQADAVFGPVASPPTVWRALGEMDQAARAKIAVARAAHRRQMWRALADRPGGFPFIQVAGQVMDGWIVLDVDASVVEAHSDKQGAAATFKKIFGFHPIIVTCANTDEILALLLRPGDTGSNTVTDHIEVLTDAIAQIPPWRRHKILFRADGAGATKGLLEWIKTTAAEHGHTWRYSVGFDVTEPVRNAIAGVPAKVWAAALDADGDVRRGAYVTDITGLLDIAAGWPDGMRVHARIEPLHPRHRKQASDIEKARGQRFQAIATDLGGHHYPRIDVLHRNHAGVEDVIRTSKDLGLRRMPSYYLEHNKAWCVAVALAADLLAWLRLLALDHDPVLSRAEPKTLRQAILNVPARLVHRARKRLIRLSDDWPHTASMITAWGKIQALAAPT
jgi:DDE family transposase